MSNVHMYLVVQNKEDFRGGNVKFTVHDFESDAIEQAKRDADHLRTPHDIYEVELIGSASVPQATFCDRRPQAMPMPSARETEGNV